MTSSAVAHKAPLSMGFSKQEHWNGLSFPSPGDLPNQGVRPMSPALLADSLPSEPRRKPTVLNKTLNKTSHSSYVEHFSLS